MRAKPRAWFHDRLGVFGGVDDPGFQGLEDFAGRQHGDRSADSLHGLASETGKPNLQSRKVVDRLERLPKPSSRFRAADAAEKRHHIVARV